jgi:outer membrane lipoprotein LolB
VPRLFALAVVGLLLAGCVSRPTLTLPPLESWEQRREVLGAVDAWRAGGRINVVAGDQAESGSLDWRQDAEAVTVSIRGPLGAGGIRLEGGPDGLILTASDGSTVALTRPEQELREIYGWSIPVASLSWWLRGLPDPDRPVVTEVAPEGWLVTLEQAGWRIEYPEYRPAAGTMLPYRIRARSADIRLTIVVKDWYFGRQAVH